MAWLLDEDDALKQKLQGFTAPNFGQQAPTDVDNIAVYFRSPDPEVRTRTYPHISIDLTEINFDPTRAHHAFEYPIPWMLPTNTWPIADDYPYPWVLVYQLTTYTRIPRQDRYMQMMMYQMFPEQYGHLVVPADGTIRRADLISVVRRDLPADTDRKRVYRNVYTIGVSSEFFLNQLRQIGIVRQVQINVIPTLQGIEYPPEVITIP